jgi:hypothetical protein
MSNKHAYIPGPWRYTNRSEISGTPSGDSTIPFAIEYAHPAADAVIPIADICNFPPATPEQTAYQEATARLIAAAPMLVEALEGLLAALGALSLVGDNATRIAMIKAYSTLGDAIGRENLAEAKS